MFFAPGHKIMATRLGKQQGGNEKAGQNFHIILKNTDYIISVWEFSNNGIKIMGDSEGF